MDATKTIIIAIIWCCVGIVCWWILCGRGSVYDNGDTINTVREQSEMVGEYQLESSVSNSWSSLYS